MKVGWGGMESELQCEKHTKCTHEGRKVSRKDLIESQETQPFSHSDTLWDFVLLTSFSSFFLGLQQSLFISESECERRKESLKAGTVHSNSIQALIHRNLIK